MPPAAVALVIVAAFTHASWNLLAKRAAHCRHFNWFYSSGAALLFLPFAVWVLRDAGPRLGWAEALVLGASSVLHALYSESLQRGYRAADLSVVYPLARGTGPLVSFFGAIVLLGERPSLLAAAGALLVVSGVFLIAGGTRVVAQMFGRGANAGADRSHARAGIFWGVSTGLFIAAYTLTDGYAVKLLVISPILVDYVGNLFRALVLAPRAWRDRASVGAEYRRYWKEALGVSILGPAGYILVLFAKTIAPVSHVAPARELSMMIGAWFGARLLGEGHGAERIFAAALIVAGVAALALG